MSFVFAPAIAIGLSLSAAHAAPSTSELAKRLIEFNPQLQRAKTEWEIQKLDRRSRLYGFFPALMFETSGGLRAKSQTGQQDPWNSQYSLSAQQTLWSPDANYWTYKEGNLNERYAETAYRLERDTLLLTFVQKVCEYLRTDSLLQIKRQELTYVETEFKVIQRSYQSGLKAYSDFLRFKGRFFRAQLTVKNLETDRRKSLVEIARLLEMETEPESIQDDLKTFDIPEVVKNEPLFRDTLLELQTELGKTRTEIVKTRFPWEVNLKLGASYSQEEYMRGMPWIREAGPWESFGLVSFKWQIFDWGISHRKVQTARLHQDKAIADRQSELTQSRSRLKQLRYDIDRLLAQLKAQDEIVKIESENLKQQTINYRNGKATFLDYSDALTSVGAAKQTLRESELQLKQLRAEALSLKGRLYDQIIAQ